jgi:2-dehydropantoate 2-reductase
MENRESRELFKELYKEGYPIVKIKSNESKQKLGNFLGPPNIVNWIFKNQRLSDFVLKGVAGKFGEVESSMLQDVRRNRQVEVDYINGVVIKLGKEYGIETPKNNWIYKEVKKLEPKC